MIHFYQFFCQTQRDLERHLDYNFYRFVVVTNISSSSFSETRIQTCLTKFTLLYMQLDYDYCLMYHFGFKDSPKCAWCVQTNNHSDRGSAHSCIHTLKAPLCHTFFRSTDQFPIALEHTVHCLGHDSILGPAIGPFFSVFIWKNFFSFWESRTMKGVTFFSFSKFWKGVFVKKKLKKNYSCTEGTGIKKRVSHLLSPKWKKNSLSGMWQGRVNSFWINFLKNYLNLSK